MVVSLLSSISPLSLGCQLCLPSILYGHVWCIIPYLATFWLVVVVAGLLQVCFLA